MVAYVGPLGFFEVGGLDLSSGTAFQPLKEVMAKALFGEDDSLFKRLCLFLHIGPAGKKYSGLFQEILKENVCSEFDLWSKEGFCF